MFDLEEDSDEADCTTVSLPLVPIPEVAEPHPLVPPQAVNLPPPQLPPVIPAVPPVNQAHPRRTAHVSCPPGEWWKVKHAAEPEAEAPVIWSDDEEEDWTLMANR